MSRALRADQLTLTLGADALAALDRRLAAGEGKTRSEVVRRLLLGAAPLAPADPTPAELQALVESLRSRVDALERAAVVASRRLDGRE